jgi:hypothetical protein
MIVWNDILLPHRLCLTNFYNTRDALHHATASMGYQFSSTWLFFFFFTPFSLLFVRHRSRSNTSTQCLNSSISLVCMLRPAGVAACLPAPHPNGKTSLRRPRRSNTTSASSGNFPPPNGCSRPRRTKWLLHGSTACTRGSENGASLESLWVDISWQSTRAWREGESA